MSSAAGWQQVSPYQALQHADGLGLQW